MKRKLIYIIAVIICIIIGVLNIEEQSENISYSAAEVVEIIPYKSRVKLYFNSNGGTSFESMYVNPTPGVKYDLPTPTKTGYYFVGWYVDEKLSERVNEYLTNLKIMFVNIKCQSTNCGSYIGNEAIVYAKWEEMPQPVYPCVAYDGAPGALKFVTNGGSAVPSMGLPVSGFLRYEDLPTPTKPGYTFAGWYVDPELNEKLVIVDNMARNIHTTSFVIDECGNTSFEGYLYAKWDKVVAVENKCPTFINEYTTIRFNTNGGSAQNELIICTTCASKNIILPTPVKNGYRFKGWYADSSLNTAITIKTTKDANLNKLSYVQEYTDSSKKCLSGNKNTTLYAKWEKINTTVKQCPTVKEEKIKLNLATDSDDTFEKITICTNCDLQAVTIPIPKKEGYIFDGWYTTPEFTKSINIISNQSSSLESLEAIKEYDNDGCETGVKETAIFAKWTKPTCNLQQPVYLKVSFETFGMSEIADDQICLSCEKRAVNIQTPYQLGYIFGGWYAEPEYTNLVKIDYSTSADIQKLYIEKETGEDGCETGNRSTTLYARWFYYNDLDKITIQYKSSDQLLSKQSYSLNDSSFELPDYEFLDYNLEGWYADEALTQKILTKDDLTKSYYGSTLSEDGKELLVSLYAKLEPVAPHGDVQPEKKDNKKLIICGVAAVIVLLVLAIGNRKPSRKNKQSNRISYTIGPNH